jgi:hypothetical protein
MKMKCHGFAHRVSPSHTKAHSHSVVADFPPKGNIPFVTTWAVFDGTEAECDVFVSIHGDNRSCPSDAPHFRERVEKFIAEWMAEAVVG